MDEHLSKQVVRLHISPTTPILNNTCI